MEIVLFMLLLLVLGAIGLSQGWDSDGSIQHNHRMRRKRHRYRKRHNLPYGADTPYDT